MMEKVYHWLRKVSNEKNYILQVLPPNLENPKYLKVLFFTSESSEILIEIYKNKFYVTIPEIEFDYRDNFNDKIHNHILDLKDLRSFLNELKNFLDKEFNKFKNQNKKAIKK